MRYGPEQKIETRKRIVAAAGRGFRKEGFGGVGVDGLARGASVTSGAFYGHFRSKADAFRAAVTAGLADLHTGIETIRGSAAEHWIERFADFYFSDRVTCDLADGCALPGLTADVVRSDAKTKAHFERELLGIIDALAAGLPEGSVPRDARAIAMAALLIGGVTMARAVKHKALRDRLAKALRDGLIVIARGSQ